IWLLGGAVSVVLYLILVSVVRNCFRNQIRLEAELARYSMVLEARVEERTRQLTQKARHLSILYAVSNALSRSLETQEILARALDELADGTGFDGGWFELRPDHARGTRLIVRRGISEGIAQRSASRAEPVARSGQVRVVPLKAMPDDQPHDVGGRVPGLVLAPLGAADQPLGVLAVVGPDVNRFTPHDVQLVAAVGRQIGGAVGNARLYAEARGRERQVRVLYGPTRPVGEITGG